MTGAGRRYRHGMARRHGEAFDLERTRPAGGHFIAGEGAERLRWDAVEVCRALSGRGSHVPFGTEVPF
jgi:hypothetical protein